MAKKTKIYRILVALSFFYCASTCAQLDRHVLTLDRESYVNDLYLVSFTGLVGGAIGLSSLSFADRPQDRIDNIAIGGAVGIVVGVLFVIWKQATMVDSLYSAMYSPVPDWPDNIFYRRQHRNRISNLSFQFSF